VGGKASIRLQRSGGADKRKCRNGGGPKPLYIRKYREEDKSGRKIRSPIASGELTDPGSEMRETNFPKEGAKKDKRVPRNTLSLAKESCGIKKRLSIHWKKGE